MEISAYGVPDEHYGEVVAVSIIRRGQVREAAKDTTEDDVRAFVRERCPGHFGKSRGIPASIQHIFMLRRMTAFASLTLFPFPVGTDI